MNYEVTISSIHIDGTIFPPFHYDDLPGFDLGPVSLPKQIWLASRERDLASCVAADLIEMDDAFNQVATHESAPASDQQRSSGKSVHLVDAGADDFGYIPIYDWIGTGSWPDTSLGVQTSHHFTF